LHAWGMPGVSYIPYLYLCLSGDASRGESRHDTATTIEPRSEMQGVQFERRDTRQSVRAGCAWRAHPVTRERVRWEPCCFLCVSVWCAGGGALF